MQERFTLYWESQNHAQVQGEADRVDDALDAVATRLDEVTRRTEAGKRPLSDYSGLLDQLSKIAAEVAQATRAELTAAEAAAEGMRGADKAARGLGRGLKEAEQEVRKADRAFDRAAKGADALKGAVAGVAAALGAEWTLAFAEAGAGLQVVTDNLRRLGITADQVADLTSSLGGGSRAAVERLASSAATAGLAFEEMGGIADAAFKIASARGESSHDVFERLSKAIATGRTALLAQYGVIVDSKKAQEQYAASIGESVQALTAQEKAAAVSDEAVRALNAAFAGQQASAYAASIGTVRDAFDDLRDSISRTMGDALVSASGLIAAIRGQIGDARAFAASAGAGAGRTTLERVRDDVTQAEDALRRIEEATAKGKDALSDVVLELQDELGGAAFTSLFGLPRDAEVTRITAAYIGAADKVAAVLETRRERLILEEAEADWQAAVKENAALAAEAAAAQEEAAKRWAAGAKARAAALAADRKAADELMGFISDLDVEAAFEMAFTPDPGAYFDPLVDAAQDALGQIESFSERVISAVTQTADESAAGATRGFDAVRDALAGVAEHAEHARGMMTSISSTVGLMGQMASLESTNAIQRARNRARDAKGSKERLAAEQAILKAEREAEKERRKFQTLDFALKGTENAIAGVVETAKAAGSYPDVVGMASHAFAATTHFTAAALYGKGAVATAKAPSVAGAGGVGLGATPPAPSPRDTPRGEARQGGGTTQIIVNGVMTDGRSVRTAVVDGLNAVGDGQLPVEETI